MKNLLTKKLKEFLGGPIYPTSFDHLYIQQDQQLFIKNSSDVRGIGPNHHIQYQKLTQNSTIVERQFRLKIRRGSVRFFQSASIFGFTDLRF